MVWDENTLAAQCWEGQAGLLLAGFLRSHGRMKTGPSHPVDFSSSLFRGFLVDELHDIRFIQLGWSVTGPRSAGFDLYLVQPRHPFFTGRFSFSSHHAWVGLESNYRTWTATLSTALTRCVLCVSRFFLPEITSRPILALFAHRVRKTCLL